MSNVRLLMLRQRLVTKPSAADLARWSADPAALFESLIVQPFVLVRPRRRGPWNFLRNLPDRMADHGYLFFHGSPRNPISNQRT